MTYVREHELAKQHQLTHAGFRKADAAVKRMRAADRRKAEKLHERAEALLAEASDLSDRAGRYHECDEYKAKREAIEDAAYWAARKEIGVFDRDEDGAYLTPPPFWNVTYKGEFVGQFQGEERSDVLRIVCPHDRDDDRKWGDFEVEPAASTPPPREKPFDHCPSLPRSQSNAVSQ